MIKALLFDFSRVLLLPKDEKYLDSLNKLHNDLSKDSKYNFFEHFKLNTELFGYLENIKDKYALYLFTTETIQESPEIAPVVNQLFQEVFSALKLNLSKNDPSSYKEIINKVRLLPMEVVFVDDLQSNIEAAKQAGLRTIHYKSNNQLFVALKEIL